MANGYLSGFSRHTDFLRKEDDDPRRDKRSCKFYDKGDCLKNLGSCFGSSHCKNYERYENGNNYIKSNSKKLITYSTKDMQELQGTFTVKYETDEQALEFTIGENISVETELVKKIIEVEENTTFIINNEKVLLIKKNIKYR